MTAITAVTSQNTTGVNSVIAISPKEIEKQILFTSKDIKPDAIKDWYAAFNRGNFISKKSFKKIKTKKIILDPVMLLKEGLN